MLWLSHRRNLLEIRAIEVVVRRDNAQCSRRPSIHIGSRRQLGHLPPWPRGRVVGARTTVAGLPERWFAADIAKLGTDDRAQHPLDRRPRRGPRPAMIASLWLIVTTGYR